MSSGKGERSEALGPQQRCDENGGRGERGGAAESGVQEGETEQGHARAIRSHATAQAARARTGPEPAASIRMFAMFQSSAATVAA